AARRTIRMACMDEALVGADVRKSRGELFIALVIDVDRQERDLFDVLFLVHALVMLAVSDETRRSTRARERLDELRPRDRQSLRRRVVLVPEGRHLHAIDRHVVATLTTLASPKIFGSSPS